MSSFSRLPQTDEPPIVLTGGGTGGHLYPALAVAEAVQRLSPATPLLYIGREAERDRTEVERRAIPFVGLPLEGLRRRLDLRNIRALWRTLRAMVHCIRILLRYPKGTVFGVGGYVSAPAMLAGMVLGWRVSLHEQNTIPGLVNRTLARWCTTVYLTYEKTLDFLPQAKCDVMGFPLRQSLIQARMAVQERSSAWRPHLLVLGGSQGARRVTEVALEAFGLLQEKNIAFSATVQSGSRNLEWASEQPRPESVEVVPFIEDMATAYARSDVVICRAGSGTLSELALWGLPAILVPYPYASENHQQVNAEVFSSQGAGILCKESELNSALLAKLLYDLLIHEDRRRDMSQHVARLAKVDASDRIANELIALASG